MQLSLDLDSERNQRRSNQRQVEELQTEILSTKVGHVLLLWRGKAKAVLQEG